MEKLIPVEQTIQEWQIVLNVIDQSNASHVQVMAVQKSLMTQINIQVDKNKSEEDNKSENQK